jgi:hypothetical protein
MKYSRLNSRIYFIVVWYFSYKFKKFVSSTNITAESYIRGANGSYMKCAIFSPDMTAKVTTPSNRQLFFSHISLAEFITLKPSVMARKVDLLHYYCCMIVEYVFIDLFSGSYAKLPS